MTYQDRNQEGKDKWVSVDSLSREERRLMYFEPFEIVYIKNKPFRVESVCLRPAELILKPV